MRWGTTCSLPWYFISILFPFFFTKKKQAFIEVPILSLNNVCRLWRRSGQRARVLPLSLSRVSQQARPSWKKLCESNLRSWKAQWRWALPPCFMLSWYLVCVYFQFSCNEFPKFCKSSLAAPGLHHLASALIFPLSLSDETLSCLPCMSKPTMFFSSSTEPAFSMGIRAAADQRKCALGWTASAARTHVFGKGAARWNPNKVGKCFPWQANQDKEKYHFFFETKLL